MTVTNQQLARALPFLSAAANCSVWLTSLLFGTQTWMDGCRWHECLWLMLMLLITTFWTLLLAFYDVCCWHLIVALC